jgi:hypothetical protein
MTTQEMTYREAVVTALQEEMRRDARTLIMGEDIGPSGGPFKTCQGLYEEFGAQRDRGDRIRRRVVGFGPGGIPAHRRNHVRGFSGRLFRPDRQ